MTGTPVPITKTWLYSPVSVGFNHIRVIFLCKRRLAPPDLISSSWDDSLWHPLLPSTTPCLLWWHSPTCSLRNKEGHLRQQNDNFIDPTINSKIDHKANHCYFQVFHWINFYLRKGFSTPLFPFNEHVLEEHQIIGVGTHLQLNTMYG